MSVPFLALAPTGETATCFDGMAVFGLSFASTRVVLRPDPDGKPIEVFGDGALRIDAAYTPVYAFNELGCLLWRGQFSNAVFVRTSDGAFFEEVWPICAGKSPLFVIEIGPRRFRLVTIAADIRHYWTATLDATVTPPRLTRDPAPDPAQPAVGFPITAVPDVDKASNTILDWDGVSEPVLAEAHVAEIRHGLAVSLATVHPNGRVAAVDHQTGVNQVVLWAGGWHVVKASDAAVLFPPQLDQFGNVALYPAELVPLADILTRPLVLPPTAPVPPEPIPPTTPTPVPDLRDQVPDFEGRAFTIVAHVDHGPAMKHPAWGNVLLPNAAPAAYVEAESRPMIQSLSNIPAAKRYARYLHLAGDAASIAAALDKAINESRDSIDLYLDMAIVPDDVVAAVAGRLRPWDLCAPQFYRGRVPGKLVVIKPLDYAAWMLDQAVRWFAVLHPDVLFKPYVACYRRGVVDPWLTSTEVAEGVVQALRASVQTEHRGRRVSRWDGVSGYGFGRADYEPAVEPLFLRAHETIRGPVAIVAVPPTVPPGPEEPPMPMPVYRDDVEYYRWVREDVGPAIAELTQIPTARSEMKSNGQWEAGLVERAGHLWRGVLKRDARVLELEWAVQKMHREGATDNEIRRVIMLDVT